MKLRKFFSIILLISLLAAGLPGGLLGSSQPAALAADPLALVAVPVQSDDTLQRFQSTGLPAYALLDGYILAGAGSAGQLTLQRTGLAFQVLDAELSSGYYLATRMPSAPKLDWTHYGRLLLDLGQQALLQTTAARAEQLSLAGAQLRYIDLSPIVLPVDQSTEQVFPEVIDPDPVVQMVIDQVTQDTVSQYDRELAGELPVFVDDDWYTITSRYTYSGESIQKAAHYVGQRMAADGLDVEYHVWNNATNPNVIGEIAGLSTPDDIFIIGAHLDDVQGTPGADDNASGSVATMLAAELLSQYQWNCTVRFAFWTGEEQGLLGSDVYAQRSYNLGENILGYLNLDMIAWNTIGSSPGIDLLYNSSMPPTQQLAQLMSDVVAAYDLDLVPQLVTSLGGGSDHSSFWDYGYTAILGIEDQGDFNPYYHGSGDTPAHTDLPYFTDFVKASIATFMHMSGCAITGGVGDLDGTVTAADGGAPIPYAGISIEDNAGQVFDIQTDNAGYYTQTLLAGTYTVTASAYAYLPQTFSGIDIFTDTLTTQDFVLQTAPTYTVSGTVTEAGSGDPLYAHLTFDGSPVEVWTNPSTGFYQAVLPEGEYTMNVMADLHRTQTRNILMDQDQTQDFALELLPCILLVDDDQNNPNVLSYYTAALDAIEAEYDIWDVASDGDPGLDNISGYNQIFWFQGGPSSNTFNSSNETAVAGYLDAGGNFFLTGQEYLYEMGLTDFGENYLHIGSYTDDNQQTSVIGQNVFSGLGTYILSYPFSNWSDVVHPDGESLLAFSGNKGDAAISYDGNIFNTVFLAYPLETVNLTGRQEVLTRAIEFFGGCGPSEGQLEGQVTDASTGNPLAGVSITADPTGIQAITNPSGYYSMTLPAGVYSVTADLAGYIPLTLPAAITVSETTVLDFALETTPPEIDVTPSAISVALVTGDYAIVPVTVSNLGGAPLSFTVSNPHAVSWLSFEPHAGKLDPSDSQVVSATLDTTELGAGVYTTTLEFTSNDPLTPLVVLPVTLTVIPACVPVSGVDFSWTPAAPLAGEVVTFTASYTGSEPVSFLWEFSDGITSTAESSARTFAPGVYTVTLTVSNDCGVGDATYTITIAAPTWWIYLPSVTKN